MSGLHLFIGSEGRVCLRPGFETVASKLSLHPNPVDTELVVDGLKGNTVYQVTVMNLLGTTVMPTTTTHTNLLGELPMTVGELPPGVYFIHVNDGTEPIMAKFMKQ